MDKLTTGHGKMVECLDNLIFFYYVLNA